MKDLYNATEHEIYNLSQKYNITDLAYGNIKGKGSLKLRKVENRLKAMQYLAKSSAASDIKIAYHILENKEKSNYWRYLMNDTGRNLSKESINTTKNILDVYLNQYISGKNTRVEAVIPAGKENLETIASAKEERSFAGAGKGKTIVATIALLAALGLGIFTGSAVKGCYDNRILREKNSRIEQLVQESNKPRMIIKTSLPAEEMDKRYEKFAADEKAGRLPVLDLTENKQKGAEYYTNKLSNKGVFVQGYMHATNKMQVPPEFSEKQLKKREAIKKFFEEQGRDIKESTLLLWHEDTRKHPRANDKYNHIKKQNPFAYAGKNLANTFDYILGDGPDIKQNLFGNEEPLISKNYEVSAREALITGDEGHQRVDGLLSDLTGIGNRHKATPGQMIKKTGDDAKQILPSAGKFIKNFFTLNWFGRRTKEGVREPGAIENIVDTAMYTVKTPLNAACVPLQAVPLIDANGIVEDAYHGVRAVRGTLGSAAATVVNTSQGAVDTIIIKPMKFIVPPVGRGLDKTNIFAHDAAQFATTGISQLFEAELIAENIDPQEQTAVWETNPEKADGAIYPYRTPTGMRYLYEAGKDIAAGLIIKGSVSHHGKGSETSVNNGNNGGLSGKMGRSGGPGTP